MTNLYKRCNLIHGDLSEYNILWHENICYFIDVSQSVEPAHPNALEFLYRDCCNICTVRETFRKWPLRRTKMYKPKCAVNPFYSSSSVNDAWTTFILRNHSLPKSVDLNSRMSMDLLFSTKLVVNVMIKQ